jgi:hypothetical protein
VVLTRCAETRTAVKIAIIFLSQWSFAVLDGKHRGRKEREKEDQRNLFGAAPKISVTLEPITSEQATNGQRLLFIRAASK